MLKKITLLINVALLLACHANNDSYSILQTDIENNNQPIYPIPAVDIQNRAMVELGARLFQDVRLSGDNTISCASCHTLNGYGVDHKPASVGISGHVGQLNSPTVFNSTYNFRQFWDGRAGSLEEQAVGPVTNPIEMGGIGQLLFPDYKLIAITIRPLSGYLMTV
nr:cytochrome-c peroxidase [Oceanicoccus sagamiensis]